MAREIGLSFSDGKAGLRPRWGCRRADQGGYTLIEILVALSLISIVLVLSAGALRHFWLVRALDGSTDNVVTKLRSTQEKVVSESYPLVYGIRFDPGTSKWYIVRFDPVDAGAGDDTCTTIEISSFRTGVEVQSASFAPDDYITEFCRTQTAAPASAAFLLFYPRGYATPGSVVLEQTNLHRTKQINVAGLTGRVDVP